MGLATEEQIAGALAKQADTRQRLGQILVDDGIVTELDLARALGAKFGVSYIDLTETPLDAAASGYIDERLARRYGVAPVRFLDDNTLLVAMVDPQNLVALQDLEIITGFSIRPAIASAEDIYGAIAKIYRERAEIDEATLADDEFKELDGEPADIREAGDEAPIVKLVNSVIAQSVDDGASDIHFEPQAKELLVRFRIDGVLHEIMSVPRRMQPAVISRLKIMAELDIAERRVPQDGRIGLVVGGKPIDMRVATPAHGVRREDRHAPPGQVQRPARSRGPGLRGEGPQAVPQVVPQAVRRHPRHRARPGRASPPRCTRRSTSSTPRRRT